MNEKISVVINTLNEEKNIEACIKSVESLADEIIVCDMYSEDSTVDIAKKLGARVFFHKRTGYVEPARYFAISQARYDWVLCIDADERMTTTLSRKLLEIVLDDEYELILFGNLCFYFGAFVKYGGFYNSRWPKFFKRETYFYTYSDRDLMIHGNFSSLVKLTERKFQLAPEYYLIHYAYPTIEKYITKTIGKYARIEGKQLYESGVKFNIFIMFLDPIKTFFRKLLIQKGYKDGVRGLILIVLYSVYRFAVWINVWQCEENREINNFD